MSTLLIIVPSLSLLAILIVFLGLRWLFTTPQLDLAGPDSSHPLWGNLLEVYDDKLTDLYTKWSDTLGGVYRLWGPFGVCLINSRTRVIADEADIDPISQSSSWSWTHVQSPTFSTVGCTANRAPKSTLFTVWCEPLSPFYFSIGPYFLRSLDVACLQLMVSFILIFQRNQFRLLKSNSGSEHKRFKKLFHRFFTSVTEIAQLYANRNLTHFVSDRKLWGPHTLPSLISPAT